MLRVGFWFGFRTCYGQVKVCDWVRVRVPVRVRVRVRKYGLG